jgi:heme-degrading monooxygenase HmoA
MQESPVLIHVWQVDPGEEGTAVQRLETMFETLEQDPGFVSGRVLQSADRSSVAAVVEMKSVEERQRLENLSEVREVLDRLPGTVNIVIRLYHEVGAYHR